MKYSLAIAALALQALPGVFAQITMNTPTNLVTCQPVMLSWTGGTAPYFLSLQDGNNFDGPALKRFDQQNGSSFSWTVDVPSKQKIVFLLRDNTGSTSVTAPVVVQPGNQDSCVDKNMSFAPSAPSSSGSQPSPPTGAVPSAAATTQTISQRPAASSTGAKASATSSNSATASITTKFGAVSIAAGIVIAILL
ncbi:secreted protein [Moniliophthora roreri MCA 2997]|uniref:Secreted protein n=2 Tax=Moniliophthora roreri TaxID=221103 RepID=V2XLN0_MONRO|nr:secreted protein [Moniliophthora roreri MCA 2997]